MRRGPRVIRHKDDTVTVTRLSFGEFHALVTAATLYGLEELRRKDISRSTRIYNENRLKVCKALAPTSVWVNPYRYKPVSQLRPHELASRMQDARLDRHQRRETARIMRELLK